MFTNSKRRALFKIAAKIHDNKIHAQTVQEGGKGQKDNY